MRLNSIFQGFNGWLRILLLAISLTLAACASGPSMVDHAFGFDARNDSPNIEIQSYRYGTSGMTFTSSDESMRYYGKSNQSGNINGPQPLGDTLYVKWQDKTSGQVFEDTVNLKPLLPFSMYRKRIYFVVQGSQLHVYLTDLSTPKPKEMPIVGPFRVQSYVTQQIYPTRLPK